MAFLTVEVNVVAHCFYCFNRKLLIVNLNFLKPDYIRLVGVDNGL